MLLVHHLLLCSVESCEGLYKDRGGSLQCASFPGVSCGAQSDSPYFLLPLLPGCSTFTWLLKVVTPLRLDQCQTGFLRTGDEILRTVKVDANCLPSFLLCFCGYL